MRALQILMQPMVALMPGHRLDVGHELAEVLADVPLLQRMDPADRAGVLGTLVEACRCRFKISDGPLGLVEVAAWRAALAGGLPDDASLVHETVCRIGFPMPLATVVELLNSAAIHFNEVVVAAVALSTISKARLESFHKMGGAE